MKNNIEIIRNEFRRSDEARYIHRLHGVLLVLLGLSTVKAGKLLGDPQRTIAHWVIQFKSRGPDALKDAQKSGRRERLSAAQKKFLTHAIATSPKKVGLDADVWTGALVATVLKKRYSVTLSPRHCHRILKALQSSTES